MNTANIKGLLYSLLFVLAIGMAIQAAILYLDDGSVGEPPDPYGDARIENCGPGGTSC